ncbi:predicted protein [Plenodomus lingam JN3]|uniref:Predicted protein n=1 Tax=Leptosphaeria maculans (strain JN3 / isolate v23.1.3 / race Av1-4-5-6-7-8) TaxID=985895 RepID=E4ZI16_LEPMJ|nr:predicted protein [Plenodomus lingam JN3]CBX91159.1 predicted protein [Plenodomus lingam JN3]
MFTHCSLLVRGGYPGMAPDPRALRFARSRSVSSSEGPRPELPYPCALSHRGSASPRKSSYKGLSIVDYKRTPSLIKKKKPDIIIPRPQAFHVLIPHRSFFGSQITFPAASISGSGSHQTSVPQSSWRCDIFLSAWSRPSARLKLLIRIYPICLSVIDLQSDRLRQTTVDTNRHSGRVFCSLWRHIALNPTLHPHRPNQE